MSEKPHLLVTRSDTGEVVKYDLDDESELDSSFECIDSHFSSLERAKKNRNKSRQEEHIRMLQKRAVEYLSTEGRKHSYTSVLVLLLGTAKYGGRIHLTKDKIAEKVGCSRATIDRALNHMFKHGMLTTDEFEGRTYYYFPKTVAQKGYQKLKGSDDIVRDAKQKRNSVINVDFKTRKAVSA